MPSLYEQVLENCGNFPQGHGKKLKRLRILSVPEKFAVEIVSPHMEMAACQNYFARGGDRAVGERLSFSRLR
jgi:hypothetical protein